MKRTAAFLVLAILGIWLIPGVSDYPLSRLEAAELIGFALVVGAYGTLAGVAGGFLIVPILLLVWHLPSTQAAGTSLVVVFLNAAAGSASFHKQGRIDYKSGFWFAIATLPGSIAGAFLSRYMSGRVFGMTFGALLLIVAALLLWKPVRGERSAVTAETARGSHRVITDGTGTVWSYDVNMPLGMLIAFGIGFISSALGIGGGIFHVPALIHVLHFPPGLATATAQFILAVSSVVGAGTHVALGHVLFGPAALMGIGVMAGAQIGAALSTRAKGATTVRLLAVAMLIVGARLLVR